MLKCGLLGKKLGHSYSPQIHALLGDYEYLLYEKTEEELETFILRGRWDGLNVTIPYKKSVLKYCNALSEAASATGSVNTLVRKDGRLYGDNTDVYGFSCLLDKNHADPEGKKVLVLGNGGASASIKYVLEKRGARVVIISRSGPETYENLDRHADASLIVNTTPVGMYPANGESPLSLNGFPCLETVLDIIYNPARTALVLQAEKMGITCDTGLHMLVAQALRSSELFTGCTVSLSRIGEIEKQLSSEMRNIVLIGMPGSGKSTIAGILGRMTGREVTDLDQEFERTTGIFPGKYIEEYGEEAFRKIESALACEAGKSSGKILSTGGGVVTVPDNYPYLHQNSVIIWIRRNIDDLSSDGRPLSQVRGNHKLYEVRKPLYESFADHTVDNNGDPAETAARILELL